MAEEELTISQALNTHFQACLHKWPWVFQSTIHNAAATRISVLGTRHLNHRITHATHAQLQKPVSPEKKETNA